MKAKILKRVVHDGKTLNPGDIADITQWRNTRSLLSGRYLEILDEQAEQPKPKAEEVKPLAEELAPLKPKATAKIKDTK